MFYFLVSKFGLPLILIISDKTESHQTNVISLFPSLKSISKAVIDQMESSTDLSLIYYHNPTDINPYLEHKTKQRQFVFQSARNLSIKSINERHIKNIILSRCDKETGKKFLDEAMNAGKLVHYVIYSWKLLGSSNILPNS